MTTHATTLGFALLGCGDMGMHLAQQAATIDGVRLVSGLDVDAERRERFSRTFSGSQAFGDVESAVRAPGVDAVIVASPPFLHRELAEAAARAGKHVFSEKPLAPTLDACDAIIAACRAAGVRLMTGQVLRYIQPFATIKEIVDRGTLGRIFGMEMRRFGSGWHGAAREWRNQGAATGGMLMEINAHEFDFLRYVCGDVATVDARMGRFVHQNLDFADFGYILLGFASGAVGSLHASLASALSSTDGVLHGTEGSLTYRWSRGTQISYARFGDEKPADEVPQTTEEPYRRELREFVEALRADAEPTITGEEGRKAVELALASYTSSLERRIVTLPLAPADAAPSGEVPFTTVR
ncbi:MAG: Gfo/Idh/MocA family oxidoreductase [Chloroflexota bacterium]